MELYVAAAGDTLWSVAQRFGVPLSRLLADNDPPNPDNLVAGQTLVVQFPEVTHTVSEGETASAIARQYGLTLRQLLRNNPGLGGSPALWPGQTLVITYRQPPKKGTLTVNGYAYPTANMALIQAVVPYLTYLTPFTYGITRAGGLVGLEDWALIARARAGGAAPLMHLSTLSETGRFSSELASAVLQNAGAQSVLIGNILNTLQARGYGGLDVDFEFIPAQDGPPYAAFLTALAGALHPQGYLLATALAPKTRADQPGLLYEAHNYRALGEAVDRALLMTYEWGYTYGPPMAVAPLPNVRRVVEYALTEIPAGKLWMGVPNYGYDWRLPYVRGESKATSLSNRYAVGLAARYGAAIQFDQTAQAPWFGYRDEAGVEHVVWFEDARSIQAKLGLAVEYGLDGVGYWNLVRPFPQNWQVLNAEYNIRDPQYPAYPPR